MNARTIAAALVLTALAPELTAADPITDAAQYERLVAAAAERGDFEGAVLVADGERVLFEGATGLANQEWGIPSAPDTRFHICSITKQFTAVLIMQLVDEGRVKLDDPITAHLPWYRADTGDRITVQDLLAHTSGLPEFPFEFDLIDDGLAFEGNIRGAIERFGSADPDFEPGSAFRYSNTDYMILGAIIEAMDGRSFEASLRSRILEPLDLRDTGMRRWESVIPRMATGYVREGDDFEKRLHFGQLAYAAAGMYSTVRDLHRWNLAIMRNEVLSPEATATMLQPVEGLGADANYVALGSWVYRRPLPPDNALSPTLVERRGSITPFTALSVFLPETEQSIILLSNYEPADIHGLPYAPGLPLDLLMLLQGRATEAAQP